MDVAPYELLPYSFDGRYVGLFSASKLFKNDFFLIEHFWILEFLL
jgi:hypothetical protein